MSVLTVENISKSFGKFQAVKNLSFSLEEGTMFGLLGPNGAGKTTTIRMLMDIIIPFWVLITPIMGVKGKN